MKKTLWLLLVVLSFLSCDKEEVEIPSKQADRLVSSSRLEGNRNYLGEIKENSASSFLFDPEK